MTMIKSYTDIEQSKKLAEILSLESADNTWVQRAISGDALNVSEEMQYIHCETPFKLYSGIGIPCWSLAALLNVLPPYLFEFERGIDLNIYRHLNGKKWHCSYMPNCIENMKTDKFKLITSADTLIDACYDMILKLHNENLI